MSNRKPNTPGGKSSFISEDKDPAPAMGVLKIRPAHYQHEAWLIGKPGKEGKPMQTDGTPQAGILCTDQIPGPEEG